MQLKPKPLSMSPYDHLADEYYDARHQTCRNFDHATIASIAVGQPNMPGAGLILEVGCGRGRCGEFLGLPSDRVVHLDSSQRMLELPGRENCVLKVCSSATAVPLASSQFAAVVGFLVDPFMGLLFLSEAYRLLVPGGVLFLTTPSEQWGIALRGPSDSERSVARFIDRDNRAINVPSVLFSPERLNQTDDRIYGFLCALGFRITLCQLARIHCHQI